MLIEFTFENWASFRDKTTFSMVASREKQHPNHIRLPKSGLKLLPIASIYGGNASGKTKFCDAVAFARKLIVTQRGPESPIPLSPFLLDRKSTDAPSVFSFDILCVDKVYKYSFTVSRKKVLSESLETMTTSRFKTIFNRRDQVIELGDSLKNSKEASRLTFAAEGTQENQLFLSNTISQKIDCFKDVFDWFQKQLVVISPLAEYTMIENLFNESHPMSKNVAHLMSQLDTGIEAFCKEEIPIEHSLLKNVALEIKETIKAGDVVRVRSPFEKERYLVSMQENGELLSSRLATKHKASDGAAVRIELRDESDGTLRLLDLLPAFVNIANEEPKVYIIDEMNRSFHTLLTRRLIEFFLDSQTQKSQTQLIFTTHDLLIMDQDLLRRDEMWITERDITGASSVIPLSDYKDIRSDKNILKSYLEGRMGGIPKLPSVLHKEQ